MSGDMKFTAGKEASDVPMIHLVSYLAESRDCIGYRFFTILQDSILEIQGVLLNICVNDEAPDIMTHKTLISVIF